MTPFLTFQICGALVMPQWLLMLILPNWRITRWLVKSKMVIVILCFVYLFYIIGHFDWKSFSDFGSLEGIKALFANDNLLLAGWIHYLAFDLFAGSWIWQNAKTRHVPHAWVVPSLLLCFIMGPVGLLFYLGARLLYPPQIQAVL